MKFSSRTRKKERKKQDREGFCDKVPYPENSERQLPQCCTDLLDTPTEGGSNAGDALPDSDIIHCYRAVQWQSGVVEFGGIVASRGQSGLLYAGSLDTIQIHEHLNMTCEMRLVKHDT